MSPFSGIEFLADLFGRDIDGALAQLDESVEWTVPGDPRYGGGVHRGRDAVVAFFATVLELFPAGLAIEDAREWQNAEGAAVEAVLSGRAANALPYRNHYVFVFDVFSGTGAEAATGAIIRRVREHCDTSYAQALLSRSTT